MHTTLIVINDLDDGYKPTPDDICQYWDFDRYIDYVKEFDDEDMRKKEFKMARYSLLGQEVKDDGTFTFNKNAFRNAMVSSAYEFGLLEGKHKSLLSEYEEIQSIIAGLDVFAPVAYGGVIYEHVYLFMNVYMEDRKTYRITDVYDVHI